MKRLLPSIMFALALHLLLLSSDLSWLKLATPPAPAAKSLTISLSADNFKKHRAAVPDKAAEKQPEPALDQKPPKNSAVTPAPPQAEKPAQPTQSRPLASSQNNLAKAQPKKNLKALTRKMRPIKTDQAARRESAATPRLSSAAHAKIFGRSRLAPAPTSVRSPADHSDMKKTHRVPDGALKSTTSAAVQPAAPKEDIPSGAVLKIARPLFKQNRSPLYPPKARRMGYEGTVMLKVLINENGRVNHLKVLESSGYGILDRAALSAVKKWLFEPGTEGGIKKKMWVKIPIRFQLE